MCFASFTILVSAYLHGGKCLLQLTTNGFTFAAFVGHKVTCRKRVSFPTIASVVLRWEEIHVREEENRYNGFALWTSYNFKFYLSNRSFVTNQYKYNDLVVEMTWRARFTILKFININILISKQFFLILMKISTHSIKELHHCRRIKFNVFFLLFSWKEK